MTTRLDKTIKRELDLGGERYMVSVGPEGIKIAVKGRRKGREVSWQALLSGEVELGRDLAMSLEMDQALDPTEPGTS